MEDLALNILSPFLSLLLLACLYQATKYIKSSIAIFFASSLEIRVPVSFDVSAYTAIFTKHVVTVEIFLPFNDATACVFSAVALMLQVIG